MRFDNAAIPAGFVWSSPFARWQGALAEAHSLDVATAVTARALADRGLPADAVDALVLGWTVPQKDIFYGAPTLAARLGATSVPGTMVSQACATSVAALQMAAATLTGDTVHLAVATDRISNAPLLTYPAPSAAGGAPQTTHWALDSFTKDPWAGAGMLATADAVAAENGFTRQDIDNVAFLRSQQYSRALADDRAFQRRYMVPVDLPGRRGTSVVLDSDEGVRPLDGQTVGTLAPVDPTGVHTYATQTHPADGCAGAVITSIERARELSRGDGIVRILATGAARVERSRMPKAPVPAAQAALRDAGLTIADLDAVTTHNPFAVNDLYFSTQTGFPLERMNSYGSSLIFGHPQAPTGLRSIAELAEELRLRGGGTGLFTGCAAGDSGAAIVLRVED